MALLVDEVAASAIRTVAFGVKCAAQLRLVFGMPGQVAQLKEAVRKLAFFPVLADSVLLKWVT